MITSRASSLNFGQIVKSAVRWSAIAAMVVVVGCKSTKKVEDASESAAPTDAAPQETPAIDSTPMTFDAQGSDGGKIDGLRTVNFDYDRSALSAETKKAIKGNADWMKKNKGTNVQIEGHCDVRGSIEYNLALGERRAKAVKEYMVSLGIGAKRLSIISYGKERTLASGESEADHAKNRRANFVPIAN